MVLLDPPASTWRDLLLGEETGVVDEEEEGEGLPGGVDVCLSLSETEKLPLANFLRGKTVISHTQHRTA